jgi:hypothetical protein
MWRVRHKHPAVDDLLNLLSAVFVLGLGLPQSVLARRLVVVTGGKRAQEREAWQMRNLDPVRRQVFA